MRYLVLLAFLLASTPVVGDELVIHTLSYHKASDTKHDPNNTNLGVGYSREDGWSTGIYYNTYRNPTAYVAKDFWPAQKISAFAGLGTGYDSVSGLPLTLIGGLRFTVPLTDRSSLKLLVAPGIFGTQTVAHLTLTFKL